MRVVLPVGPCTLTPVSPEPRSSPLPSPTCGRVRHPELPQSLWERGVGMSHSKPNQASSPRMGVST